MSAGKEYIDQMLQKYKVLMISKSTSPDGTKAQVIFDHYRFDKGDYFFIDIDKRADCDEIEQYLKELSGTSTVPSIFIDGKYYGGADDLIVGQKLESFDQRLKDAGIKFDRQPMH
uniref:Glutaredoxin domain-containing protein n=1 Tax=Panagrolaimus sp. PS1159 TaxID=55785 RepID=A0AC35F0N6_9BILA